MTPRTGLARTVLVLRVLLAAAVCCLLALLAHDHLLPRLVPAPVPAATPAAPSTSSPPAVAAPSPDEVAAVVDPALDEAPGVASAQFRDLRTGEVVLDRGAAEPVAPASTLKVLAAAAVLDTLGADTTLRTEVVALPAEGGGTELVLVGGGDALLGTGASDPSRVDGRAGLRTLAEETVAGLRARGVTGPVTVTTDLRLFEDRSPLNPAWPEGTAEGGDVSAVQPLATYGGRAEPGTGRDRVTDPAGFAAQTFLAHLEEAVAASGADVQVTAEDGAPATDAPREDVLAAEPVAAVASAPLREQVAHLLAHSDNQVAETLAHTAAAAAGRPATHDGAAGLLEAEAADLGVDTAGMALLDASGLAVDDRISAAQLAGVLTGLAEGGDPDRAAVLDALPRPGEDSTLGERFHQEPARGSVAAKTGTLDQTVSLAGTVTTASGRELAFAVVCSEVDWRLEPAREAVDAAVAAVAGL